jgi:hypothetical protein
MVGCVIPRAPGSNGAARSYCKTGRCIRLPKLGNGGSAAPTNPRSDRLRSSRARWRN